MKFLKKLLIGVLVLVGVLLLIGLFLPRELKVEKSRTIEAPKAQIKEEVVNLKHFHEWSPWTMTDTGAEYSFEGSMGDAGSSVKWKSDDPEMGTGSCTLKRVTEDSVFMELVFLKPHKSRLSSQFAFEDLGDEVQVIWGVEEPLSYPTHMIPHLMGVEGTLGEQFSRGLKNLKAGI